MARKAASNKNAVSVQTELPYKVEILSVDLTSIYTASYSKKERMLEDIKYIKWFIDKDLMWRVNDGFNKFTQPFTKENLERFVSEV